MYVSQCGVETRQILINSVEFPFYYWKLKWHTSVEFIFFSADRENPVEK